MHRKLAIGTALFLILGLAGCGHGQHLLLLVAESVTPDAIFRLDTEGERVIFLTIDDGPSVHTDAILNMLEEYDATATFFVHADHIPGHEDVVIRTLDGGHRLANHMPADENTKKLSPSDFEDAFISAHSTIASYGETPTYFRPPLGKYNPDTMSGVLNAYAYTEDDEGRMFVLGSFLPWEAGGLTETGWGTFNRTMARTYGRQLGGASFPGAIVVFHDGPRLKRTENTLISLEAFLRITEHRGYRVEALPQPRLAQQEFNEGRQALASSP
ncbi:MAG: polysaccharide deacetylase family protein [Pseudomonadota bacterium]